MNQKEWCEVSRFAKSLDRLIKSKSKRVEYNIFHKSYKTSPINYIAFDADGSIVFFNVDEDEGNNPVDVFTLNHEKNDYDEFLYVKNQIVVNKVMMQKMRYNPNAPSMKGRWILTGK